MDTQSVVDFKSFSFNPLIQGGIDAAGYQKPTPIQAQAIPLVLSGADLMGLAQTGTGKTAAFVIPILERLLSKKQYGVRVLILAPTRELAEQINTVILMLSQKTRLRSITIYGGVAKYPQEQLLRRGTEIIVACPGRLLDHLESRTVDLRSLEMLVIDEADQLFDMGFLPEIRQILKHVPSNRQTLLFSATMAPEIRRLAEDILQNPKTIQIAHNKPSETVSHSVYFSGREQKLSILLNVLKQAQNGSVLVFTRTKHKAIQLSQQLVREGYRATSLQGNLSQNKRQRAMDGFRRSEFQILVSTDIAARGIDVSHVEYVINFDIPETPEAYTHRIGRTGRAEKKGQAISLVTHEDLYLLRAIERLMGKKIEIRSIDGLTVEMPVNEPIASGAPSRYPRRNNSNRGYSRQQGNNNNRGARRQGSPAYRSKQNSRSKGSNTNATGPSAASRA